MEKQITEFIKCIRENGDHPIGMITGTHDYLSNEELNEINSIFQKSLNLYLKSLGKNRIDEMYDKHRKYVKEMLEDEERRKRLKAATGMSTESGAIAMCKLNMIIARAENNEIKI